MGGTWGGGGGGGDGDYWKTSVQQLVGRCRLSDSKEGNGCQCGAVIKQKSETRMTASVLISFPPSHFSSFFSLIVKCRLVA